MKFFKLIFTALITIHSLQKTALTLPRGKKAGQTSLAQKRRVATNYLKDSLQIIRHGIKEHDIVAAFSASSPWLVASVIQPLQQASTDPLNILEVGFGPGTITRELVESGFLLEADRLDAVEIDQEWATQASDKYSKEAYPNVHIHCAAFQEWESPIFSRETGEGVYDFIFCTIPFTRLPRSIMQGCLAKIQQLLKPGGTFVYITLIGARSVGNAISKCGAACNRLKACAHIQRLEQQTAFNDWCRTNFDKNLRRTVLLNFTPAYVHELTKKAKTA